MHCNSCMHPVHAACKPCSILWLALQCSTPDEILPDGQKLRAPFVRKPSKDRANILRSQMRVCTGTATEMQVPHDVHLDVWKQAGHAEPLMHSAHEHNCSYTSLTAASVEVSPTGAPFPSLNVHLLVQAEPPCGTHGCVLSTLTCSLMSDVAVAASRAETWAGLVTQVRALSRCSATSADSACEVHKSCNTWES
jgi:hypothetical protein